MIQRFKDEAWWWLQLDVDLDPLLWALGLALTISGIVADASIEVALGAFVCVLGTTPAAGDPRT